MDNENFENSEWKTFILEYIKDNLYGLILLVFVFFIIYFVDYINNLNIILYSASNPIPGLSSVIVSSQKKTKRKIRKIY